MSGIRDKNIGITIYVYRTRLRLSKAALGRKIGYTRSAVLLIENGKRGIPQEMLKVIAKVLQIDLKLLTNNLRND